MGDTVGVWVELLMLANDDSPVVVEGLKVGHHVKGILGGIVG